jgi:hypothetical protein
MLVSMRLMNWQEAQDAVQKWSEQGKKPEEPEAAPPAKEVDEITLDQAWESLVARAKARNLSAATIYNYQLLQKRMKTFARKKGLPQCREHIFRLQGPLQ